MTIPVLADVILPPAVVSAGIDGSSLRKNLRSVSQSGAVHVNILWDRTLRKYKLGVVPLDVTAWASIEGLFEVTEGGAYGFLMQDPKDQKVTTATGFVAGLTSTTFQLVKRYTSAGSTRTKDRKITRPVTAGFSLYISGVLKTLTTHYTFDATTGIVTIPSAPSAASVTWAGQFYVPVQFEQDQIDFSLVRAGSFDNRIVAGPAVGLVEVRE